MKHNIYQYIENEAIAGKCCWKGCDYDGIYPAPKSPLNLRERHNFCLDHVRKYNGSWDFFANMSQKDIEAFHIDSITGHRKTRPRSAGRAYYSEDDLREQVFREFGFNANNKPANSIPANEKEALDVLGLKYPVTMDSIKKKYKELAKKYHPDVNPNEGEEKLKAINLAYGVLKNCGSF